MRFAEFACLSTSRACLMRPKRQLDYLWWLSGNLAAELGADLPVILMENIVTLWQQQQQLTASNVSPAKSQPSACWQIHQSVRPTVGCFAIVFWRRKVFVRRLLVYLLFALCSCWAESNERTGRATATVLSRPFDMQLTVGCEVRVLLPHIQLLFCRFIGLQALKLRSKVMHTNTNTLNHSWFSRSSWIEFGRARGHETSSSHRKSLMRFSQQHR